MKNYFEKLVRANFRFGRMCKTGICKLQNTYINRKDNFYVRI